jgi:hypothetical protein
MTDRQHLRPNNQKVGRHEPNVGRHRQIRFASTGTVRRAATVTLEPGGNPPLAGAVRRPALTEINPPDRTRKGRFADSHAEISRVRKSRFDKEVSA